MGTEGVETSVTVFRYFLLMIIPVQAACRVHISVVGNDLQSFR